MNACKKEIEVTYYCYAKHWSKDECEYYKRYSKNDDMCKHYYIDECNCEKARREADIVKEII